MQGCRSFSLFVSSRHTIIEAECTGIEICPLGFLPFIHDGPAVGPLSFLALNAGKRLEWNGFKYRRRDRILVLWERVGRACRRRCYRHEDDGRPGRRFGDGPKFAASSRHAGCRQGPMTRKNAWTHRFKRFWQDQGPAAVIRLTRCRPRDTAGTAGRSTCGTRFAPCAGATGCPPGCCGRLPVPAWPPSCPGT